MPVTYQPWVVLLSIAVAIQGAYVGLCLAVQIGEAGGVRRRLLLAGAAISFAVAIWAMHFVGMLAIQLPFPVDYLVFPTLLSFLVCVLVVGGAIYAISSGPMTPLRLSLSSVLMGAGIFTMHYIGMSALHSSAHMVHAWGYVIASLAVAIAASGLALWLAAARGGRMPLILSATVFGIAVSGMHYTAMAGVTLFPHQSASSGAPALSTDFLAIVVAVVAFCVSGIFLLLLVPDRKRSASMSIQAASLTIETPQPVTQAIADTGAGEIPELGRGTYAPLGGAGAPPRRFARHLPIEREGAKQFVSVDDVVAVHANAHYTYVFNGNDKLFCPLAIGDVESRLDGSRFVRVHRSHIINIERVVGYRRSGDSELVEMKAAQHYAVPVSRSRLARLKSRIALKTSADGFPNEVHRKARFAPQ
jgi:NO-binding membrane sensor protein with MHYT domain